MPNIYSNLQAEYASSPIPQYQIPAQDVFPNPAGIQAQPYQGSAGAYGVPGNMGVSGGINGGGSQTGTAAQYGEVAAASSPEAQPAFWVLVLMVVGFAGLAWASHSRAMK